MRYEFDRENWPTGLRLADVYEQERRIYYSQEFWNELDEAHYKAGKGSEFVTFEALCSSIENKDLVERLEAECEFLDKIEDHDTGTPFAKWAMINISDWERPVE